MNDAWIAGRPKAAESADAVAQSVGRCVASLQRATIDTLAEDHEKDEKSGGYAFTSVFG